MTRGTGLYLCAMKSFAAAGISLSQKRAVERPMRVMSLPGMVAPNCSRVPPAELERLMEVWMTFLALLENQRVMTMMSPERTRKMVGVADFPARLDIMS